MNLIPLHRSGRLWVATWAALASVFANAADWQSPRSLSSVAGAGGVQIRVAASTAAEQRLEVRFPQLTTLPAQGPEFAAGTVSLALGNAERLSLVGMPVVPAVPVRIAIPQGHSVVSVDVRMDAAQAVPGRFVVEHGQRAYPTRPGFVPPVTPQSAAVYGADAVFPAVRFANLGVQHQNGVAFVVVMLYPVEYSPVSGRLAVSAGAEVRVATAPSAAAQALAPVAKAAPVLFRADRAERVAAGVDNPAVVATYADQTPPAAAAIPFAAMPPVPADFKYVIIAPPAFRDASGANTLQTLLDHRAQQGLSGTIIPTVAITTAYPTNGLTRPDAQSAIRDFIRDAHNQWGTEYVLLAGDTEFIPARLLADELDGSAGIPSDLYYQCLDGTFDLNGNLVYGEEADDADLYAEVAIGRVPVSTVIEISHFVGKVLRYELTRRSARNLHGSLMVSEYLGFGGPVDYGSGELNEVVDGSSNHGYSTLGFQGSAQFTQIDKLEEAAGVADWQAPDLITAVNSGDYSVVVHNGHADETVLMKLSAANAGGLTNVDAPLFGYSMACHAGAFDDPLSIGENLLLSTDAGFFGAVLNSRYGLGRANSTDSPSCRYARWFWDGYFAAGEPRLGRLNQYSHERVTPLVLAVLPGTAPPPLELRYNYYTTNLLGDPATPLAGIDVAPWIEFDRDAYNSVNGTAQGADAHLRMADPTLVAPLPATIDIPVESRTPGSVTPYVATVTFTLDPDGTYSATLAMAGGTWGAHGDILTAAYTNTLNAAVATATARIDNVSPAITNRAVALSGGSSARVTWTTDEPADSTVIYDTVVPFSGGAVTVVDPRLVTTLQVVGGATQYLHSVNITNLAQTTVYFFAVASADAAGNTTRVPVAGSVVEAEHLTLATPSRPIAYRNMMDAGTAGWTAAGNKPLWEYGIPTYGPPPGSTRCWGTILDGRYPDQANGWVVTPDIHVREKPELSFRTWYDIDYSGYYEYFDGGFVEISINGGGWLNITPSLVVAGTFAGGTTLSGQSLGWRDATLVLPDAAQNSRIQLRFRLESDIYRAERGNPAGWYIDDVVIRHSNPPGLETANLVIVDAPVDGDGFPEPGETVDVQLTILNTHTTRVYTNVVGEISCATPGITLLPAPTPVTYGTVAPTEAAPAVPALRLAIAPSVAPGTVVVLRQTLIDAAREHIDTEITFIVTRAEALSGTVFEAIVVGGVSVPGPVPVAGATVSVDIPFLGTKTTLTDGAGHFTLAGASPDAPNSVVASKVAYSDSAAQSAIAPTNLVIALGKAYAVPVPPMIALTASLGATATTTLTLDNSAGTVALDYTLGVVPTLTQWLTLDPTSGTIPPGQSAVITVTAAAGRLPAQTYLANVQITSNDADFPVRTVPVSFTVQGVYDLYVAGADVTLDTDADGFLEPGETANLTLRIGNDGDVAAGAFTNVVLTCDDPGVTIAYTGTAAAVTCPLIPAGQVRPCSDAFTVTLPPMADGTELMFRVALFTTNEVISLEFPFTAYFYHSVTGMVLRLSDGLPLANMQVLGEGNPNGLRTTYSTATGNYALHGLRTGFAAVTAYPVADPRYSQSATTFYNPITGDQYLDLLMPYAFSAGPILELASYSFVDQDADNTPEAGEWLDVRLVLLNRGQTPCLAPVAHILSADLALATVDTNAATFATIPVGGAGVALDTIRATLAPGLPDGTIVPFLVEMYADAAAAAAATPSWFGSFTITVGTSLSVSGVVTLDGAPLAGCAVTLTRPDGSVATVLTDALGAYRHIGLVTTNAYTVGVVPPVGAAILAPLSIVPPIPGDLTGYDFALTTWGFTVTPTSFDVTVAEGTDTHRTLTLSNGTANDVAVTLGVEYRRAAFEQVRAQAALPPPPVRFNWKDLNAAKYREDHLVVRFRDGTTFAERFAFLQRNGLKAVYFFHRVPAVLASFDAAAKGLLVRATEAQADPIVEYSEPSLLVSMNSVVPNDPRFDELYGLRNQRQTGGSLGADIGATDAWEVSTGSADVTVGIMDTGLMIDHPDLAANVWNNPVEQPGVADPTRVVDFTDPHVMYADYNNDGIPLCGPDGILGNADDDYIDHALAAQDDDHNGYIDDLHGWNFGSNNNDLTDLVGHGTHVAGTIAAVGDNGLGVAGVNWTARLMSVKVVDDGGSFVEQAVIAKGIEYMIDQGVKVSNHSWGGWFGTGILAEMIQNARDAGHLMVIAAGNDGIDNDTYPHYPSSYPYDNIISVAATDHHDQLTIFSCFGETSVDIAAPGLDILSTYPPGLDFQMPDGSIRPSTEYESISGTSMATPHVTGAVALLLSISPEAPSSVIRGALFAGARRDAALNGWISTGGHLDLSGAITALGRDWLLLTPQTVTVLAGTTADIDLTFNAGLQLAAGNYEATIHVDTAEGNLTVPVALTVDSRPVVGVAGWQVDDSAGGDGDGCPEAGETFTLLVSLLNTGTIQLNTPTGTLSSASVGVSIAPAAATRVWPTLTPGDALQNTAAFSVTLAPGTVGPVLLDLALSGRSGGATLAFPLQVSLDVAARRSIRGTVRDLAGTGIANAVVEFWGAAAGRVVTDAAGAYHVKGLGDGAYRVRAIPTVHERSAALDVTLTGADALAQDFVVGAPGAGIGILSRTLELALQYGTTSTTNFTVVNTNAAPFAYRTAVLPHRRVALLSDRTGLEALAEPLRKLGLEVEVLSGNYVFTNRYYGGVTYQNEHFVEYSWDDALLGTFDFVIADLDGDADEGRLLLEEEAAAYDSYLARGGRVIFTGANLLSRPDDAALTNLVGATSMDRASVLWSTPVVQNMPLWSPVGGQPFAAASDGQVLPGTPFAYDLVVPDLSSGQTTLATAGAATKLLRKVRPDGGTVYLWTGNPESSDVRDRGVWQDLLRDILLDELSADVPWLTVGGATSGTLANAAASLTLTANPALDLSVGLHQATVVVFGNYPGAETDALQVSLDIVGPSFRAYSTTGVKDWRGNWLPGDGGQGSSVFQVLWAGPDGIVQPPRPDGAVTGDDVLLLTYVGGADAGLFGTGPAQNANLGRFEETFRLPFEPDGSERWLAVRAWDGPSYLSSTAYGDSAPYRVRYLPNEEFDFGSWTVSTAFNYPATPGPASDYNGDSIPDGWLIGFRPDVDPRAQIQPLDPAAKVVNAFGTLTTMQSPRRVFSTADYVYVLEGAQKRVSVWRHDGTYVTFYKGVGVNQFSDPYGLGKQPGANRFAVADAGNHRVSVHTFVETASGVTFAEERVIGSTAGTSVGRFTAPRGVALNADGFIHVADTGNNRIQVFGPTGTFLRQIAPVGAQAFSAPQSVAVHPDTGLLYITDSAHHCIQVYTSVGGWIRTLGTRGTASTVAGQFSYPSDVAVWTVGTQYRLLVAERDNNRLQVLREDGTSYGVFGGVGIDVGRFSLPNGAFPIDGSGDVYVADTGNHRIQRLSLTIDGDRDGMDDTWEMLKGLDPVVNDAMSNPDADGLTNIGEYRIGTDPLVADTDGDGIPDGVEVQTSTDPSVYNVILADLTVVATPLAGGTATGSGTYGVGTPVLIEAIANTGWEFTSWLEDGNLSASRTVTVLGDATYTAQFAVKTYTVTFDLGAHGTHGGGNPLTQIIPHGTSAGEPDVTADPGWVHTGWDQSFSAVTSDMTINATYASAVDPKRPVLTWAAVPGATWYHLWIARDGVTYQTLWLEGVTTWQSPTDLPAGNYQWWVQSWGPVVGNGAWVGPSSFIVPAVVPGALTLTAPAGPQTDINLTYRWQKDAAATWYHLWVGRADGTTFRDQWYAFSGVGEATVTINGHPAGNYTWWVQPWAPDGLGPWSGPLAFSIATAAPEKPVGTAPIGPILVVRPTFTWNVAARAQWYRVYVSRGGAPVIDQWTQATSLLAPANLSSGAHSWWIGAWNDVTGTVVWSDRVDFTVP